MSNVTCMTYDEYDSMLDRFSSVSVEPFYPDPHEISEMEKDPPKWIPFACYLYEKGSKPTTAMERYGRENLKSFINRYLVLEDSQEIHLEVRIIGEGEAQVQGKTVSGQTCLLEVHPADRYKRAYLLDGLFEKKILSEVKEDFTFPVPDMDAIVMVEFF